MRPLTSPRRVTATPSAMLGLAALGLVAFTQSAMAQDAQPCTLASFAGGQTFTLARVTRGPAPLFDAQGDCPWAGGSACLTGATLKARDTVIVSHTREGFACAYSVGDPIDHAGWVRLAQLTFLAPTINPPASAFTGTWSAPSGPPLTFGYEFGHLTFKGGGIGGRLDEHGYRATFTDYDCKVRFTLLPGYLVAGDNGKCGKQRKSIISGVYTRD